MLLVHHNDLNFKVYNQNDHCSFQHIALFTPTLEVAQSNDTVYLEVRRYIQHVIVSEILLNISM